MTTVKEVLHGDVRIEPRDGYVFVWHGRAARDVTELEEVIAGIEAVLSRTPARRLLFDSRESDMTPSAVGERLWAWLEGSGLERVGTLVHSAMLQTSVRMTGLARKVPIRAFDDEAAADAWMRAESLR